MLRLRASGTAAGWPVPRPGGTVNRLHPERVGGRPDAAAAARQDAADPALGLLEGAQEPPHLFGDRRAQGGRPYARRQPFEQRRAEPALQPGDGAGQRRQGRRRYLYALISSESPIRCCEGRATRRNSSILRFVRRNMRRVCHRAVTGSNQPRDPDWPRLGLHSPSAWSTTPGPTTSPRDTPPTGPSPSFASPRRRSPIGSRR